MSKSRFWLLHTIIAPPLHIYVVFGCTLNLQVIKVWRCYGPSLCIPPAWLAVICVCAYGSNIVRFKHLHVCCHIPSLCFERTLYFLTLYPNFKLRMEQRVTVSLTTSTSLKEAYQQPARAEMCMDVNKW